MIHSVNLRCVILHLNQVQSVRQHFYSFMLSMSANGPNGHRHRQHSRFPQRCARDRVLRPEPRPRARVGVGRPGRQERRWRRREGIVEVLQDDDGLADGAGSPRGRAPAPCRAPGWTPWPSTLRTI
jgi:hypothetical protein